MIIDANNYSLSPRRFVAGTKGSYGMETMNFRFSKDWNGLNVTVTFFPPDSEPVTVIYDHESFDIPSEVTARSGLTPYTVIGYKNTKQLVSLTGYIDVLETTLGKGKDPAEVTPTLVAQALEFMARAQRIAESVRHDADNGAFDGKTIVSAEINSHGVLIFTRSDGVSINAGNIVDKVINALQNGDEVSF